eukprot:4312555-Pyramimonas_sp.AAC.1
MGEVKEFWVERLTKMTISEVGCLVLHWQWKRNQGKQHQQDEQARGRLIYAIDQARPLGITTVSMIEGLLKSVGAERKIGPSPRGPLERDASKLLAELTKA